MVMFRRFIHWYESFWRSYICRFAFHFTFAHTWLSHISQDLVSKFESVTRGRPTMIRAHMVVGPGRDRLRASGVVHAWVGQIV
jgi:hypothetical protein